MKRYSWKYIAGLVDGEGCIDFQLDNRRRVCQNGKIYYSYSLTPRMRITLAGNCKYVLETLKTNHGGNMCTSKRSKDNPKWQDAVTWQLQNVKLRSFLQNIKQHLVVKKNQAEFVIWYIDNMKGSKNTWLHGHDKMKVFRDAVKAELSAMKFDPQRLSDVAVKELVKRLEADAIVQADAM